MEGVVTVVVALVVLALLGVALGDGADLGDGRDGRWGCGMDEEGGG